MDIGAIGVIVYSLVGEYSMRAESERSSLGSAQIQVLMQILVF